MLKKIIPALVLLFGFAGFSPFADATNWNVTLSRYLAQATCGHGNTPGVFWDGANWRISVDNNSAYLCTGGYIPYAMPDTDPVIWTKWDAANGAVLASVQSANAGVIFYEDAIKNSGGGSIFSTTADVGQGQYLWTDPAGYLYSYLFQSFDQGAGGAYSHPAHTVIYFDGPDCSGQASPVGWFMADQIVSDSAQYDHSSSFVGVQTTNPGSLCSLVAAQLTGTYFFDWAWPLNVFGTAYNVAVKTYMAEEYFSSTEAGSSCVERFYYAKFLGLIVWDVYQNTAVPDSQGCGLSGTTSGYDPLGAPSGGSGSWRQVAYRGALTLTGWNPGASWSQYFAGALPDAQGRSWPGLIPLYHN